MYYGAAYYPEHCGEERLETDARLMKEAGFNTVRMGEFAWTRLQPGENEFNFGWLDKAVEVFSRYGIKTVLGTPTACPPKYLMDRFPDIYTLDERGIRRGFGSRRHYCFNSESYLKASRAIVTAMAGHYRDNENIMAWQVDNELGGDNNTFCFCENCKKAFRQWLKAKYGDIDLLNSEWGAEVWSQLYLNFDEIDPPVYTHTVKNPSACLDYKRFCSDSAIKAQKMQVDILKSINPQWRVTTNIFSVGAQIDYDRLSADIDFVSWDDYPNLTFDKVTPYFHAMGLDACRGYKNMPFWSMETQSGTPGGDILFQTPRPGDMKRWVMQTIARGAEGILFFRWRTNHMGAEQYWHGILNHDGIPRRLYNEARETGAAVEKLSGVLDNKISRCEAAIVHSQEISWVFEIQPLILDYSYYENVKSYYSAIFNNNFNIDLISPDSDFNGYKLLILPNFIFCSPEWSPKIREFVSKGGTILMDFRSGVKDLNNKILKETLPCDFRELLGIEIEEYGIIMKDEKVVLTGEKYNGTARGWYEIIRLQSASPLAVYVGEYFSGLPAITKNIYGEGTAYYVSTMPDKELLEVLVKDIFNHCGIYPVLDAKPGVEIVQRSGGGGMLLFIINHTDITQNVSLDREYENVLSQAVEAGFITLEPRGVVVLRDG